MIERERGAKTDQNKAIKGGMRMEVNEEEEEEETGRRRERKDNHNNQPKIQ